MDAKQALEKFHHNSKWLWLQLRLTDEYRCEFIRRAIREAKEPKTRFKLGPEERRLFKL